MREDCVSLPELGLIAVTRGMIGFGAGLLVSRRLAHDRRKAVGWALLVTGALSTIPLAVRVFRRRVKPRGRNEYRRSAAAAMMAD